MRPRCRNKAEAMSVARRRHGVPGERAMDVLGPRCYEWPPGSLAFPRQFADGWRAGGPAGLARRCADGPPAARAGEEAGSLPGLGPRERASATRGCCMRPGPVVRTARELHCGVKPEKALLVGDGGAVPTGFGVATVTPTAPGPDSGAVCSTANGGWFAQSAEILAFRYGKGG
jgi:hypothetical protein